MPTIPPEVVNILKLGLVGFCFLLAFLTYKLLEKALDKRTISAALIGLIRSFMGLTLALGVLVGGMNVIEKYILKRPKYPEASSISGQWDYVCEVTNAPSEVIAKYGKGYKHGGICTITAKDGEDSSEWSLGGTRLWRSWEDKDGKPGKETVNYPWRTEWGAITSKDAISYTYAIESDHGIVKGFAWGNIKTVDGTQIIEGNFYQLPPVDPMSGTYRFKRPALISKK